MELITGQKIGVNLLPAYLHFESLSDHQYDFSNNLGGHHPAIIVLAANRKAPFSLNGNVTLWLIKHQTYVRFPFSISGNEHAVLPKPNLNN